MLFLRIIFADGERIGPGKIAVLEAVAREHSISGAARKLGMSYRRTWLLIDAMNRMFREPVVLARPGRVAGGSAEVTAFGERLIGLFRDAERAAERSASKAMRALIVAREK
jgi:molybdate transport system regulatory protein